MMIEPTRTHRILAGFTSASAVLAAISLNLKIIANSYDGIVQSTLHANSSISNERNIEILEREIVFVNSIFDILSDVSMAKRKYLLNSDLNRVASCVGGIGVNLSHLMDALNRADIADRALLIDLRGQAIESVSAVKRLETDLSEVPSPELVAAVVSFGQTIATLEEEGHGAGKQLQRYLDQLRGEVAARRARTR